MAEMLALLGWAKSGDVIGFMRIKIPRPHANSSATGMVVARPARLAWDAS